MVSNEDREAVLEEYTSLATSRSVAACNVIPLMQVMELKKIADNLQNLVYLKDKMGMFS